MASESKAAKNLGNLFRFLSFAPDDDAEEDRSPNVGSKANDNTTTTTISTAVDNAKSEGLRKSNKGGADSQAHQKNEFVRPLVWIDLEMTGLDVRSDRILEIACIVTDASLEHSVEGPNIVVHQSEEVLEQMNDWCKEHHTASGLTERVRSSNVSEQEAEQQVFDFVSQYVESGKGTIAGNSVYKDLSFLQEYMPNLATLFSHVLVDVSSVRALCNRWFPHDAKQAPEKKKPHRALEDIKESIAELRYLRGAIFKKPKR